MTYNDINLKQFFTEYVKCCIYGEHDLNTVNITMALYSALGELDIKIFLSSLFLLSGVASSSLLLQADHVVTIIRAMAAHNTFFFIITCKIKTFLSIEPQKGKILHGKGNN